MRNDMHKVIVELPRGHSHNPYRHDGRTYRNLETTPSRIGMKDGYYRTKWFSDCLGPLVSFLEKRAGRPWNKVYSEICARLDLRSTVQRHLLEHVRDFVAVHARWEETSRQGKIWIPESWGPHVPLEKSDIYLYVHPLTGILTKNESRLARRIAERKAKFAEANAKAEKRRVVSSTRQLHLLKGNWFEIELERLPAPKIHPADKYNNERTVFGYRWDCVENRMVSLDRRSHYGALSAATRLRLYGDEGLFAKSKRQLSRRELRKCGVANMAPSGLVRFWGKLSRRLARGWTMFPLFGIR